jgi:hypothetical protein
MLFIRFYVRNDAFIDLRISSCTIDIDRFILLCLMENTLCCFKIQSRSSVFSKESLDLFHIHARYNSRIYCLCSQSSALKSRGSPLRRLGPFKFLVTTMQSLYVFKLNSSSFCPATCWNRNLINGCDNHYTLNASKVRHISSKLQY